MNNSIPYLVKNGDTLESIAKELGMTDPYDLRHYHNMNAGIKDGIGPQPPAGKTLLTPSAEKIKEINAKRAAYDDEEKIETEKKEQEKQEEQEQQQKEQKEQEEKEKETAQSAHDDKYFVVNGALCCCDKAENPKQTAKLLVTSHKKVIFNDEAGKYTATEADKTFDPAAATFGKCTLKPSSGGNLPCALSPAPKWSTVYEKTSILGNRILTEISTLQCTVGGKIEVAKYGQTNTVMKEHAENTNPAALALINQAIEIPKLKTAYPSVSSIALKSLKNNPNFQAVSSDKTKNVEKVTVRPNQECTFEAKVSKGNVNLTSWVIYDGFSGDKDKRLYTEEQIGTQFKYTFPAEGKYRIEGYGQPKKVDAEAGDYKSYPDCCLDIEVVLNKLQGNELEPIDGENFSKIIQGKMRLRKDFPASFKARFLLPPTEEELENLKMYVTDASGNSLKSVKIENTVSFTPINTNAKYNFHASYKLPSGELQTQIFSGETIGNAITGITHDAHVIRRGTPMSFAVSASRFSFYIPDEQEVIAKEAQSVKWNLNGRLIGNGKGITIPGHEFMNLGKYVVEAYVTLANAYGTNAKEEEDDWRFEVKDNDVKSFSYSGIPKVGKTTFLEADNLIFPKLIANETIVWDTTIPHKTVDEKTISITPLKAGKELVKCRVNREPGKTLSIDVKQGKVLGMMFTDSNGIEIEKSSWYQTVNMWVKQEHLIGEDLTIEIWDNDAFKNDYCKVVNVSEYDGNLIPITLDSYIKNKAGNWGMLFVKITAPKLKLANENNVFQSKNHLNVEDIREIYSAQIGTQDGKERHYHADYNKISYFYAKSRGIKAGEKLKITIYEKGKKLFDTTDVTVDTSGKITAALKWDKINQKLPSRVVHAVVLDSENKILYEGNKVANGGVHITKTSALLGLAEYKSAVLVGKAKDMTGNRAGTCVCKDYDLIWGNKVSCEFRMKVVEICKDLWADNYLEMANNLMAVMAWETGETFSPSIKNPKSSATGLVQFMKDTAENLGTTTEKLSRMTAVEQLDYVKKYFANLKNKKLEFVDFYLQVLFPASMGKADEHVVFSKDGEGLDKDDKNYDLRIKAYEVNKGFDTNLKYGNNDGMVTKGEIKKGIQIYIDKGKSNKAIILSCDLDKNKNFWHHPVDNPQLRGWYSTWAPERSIHSNNIPGRSKGKHDGLDFYAPTGTIVYACVDSEVNEIYYSESYGNCINIQGEYKGQKYWFFYAHLSEIFINAKDENGHPTKITAGKEIGKSGKTGSSATALKPNQVHLHFELRTTSARTGGRIDPMEKIIEFDTDVIKNPKKENQP